ncbi:glycosyltransferase family 9 protein [Terracidiphilus sp.]|uniref:glycosyltransferase family 9 protein n=1 Tax=Terracidiphilus sp. TaxID=1964191 RepID=UPI003C1F585F
MRTQSQFRLLVVRLGAMGDILHALPAVTALRQTHPGWQIDWVVEPAWAPLLTANSGAETRVERGPAQPLVDNIHPAAVKAWARSPLSGNTLRKISGLRRDLRAGRYDAVLDFQGAIRSAMIGRLAGCRRVIGEAVPREPAAKWLFTERVETRGVHVIEQDIEVASAVAGDTLQPMLPLLPVDPEAETWCDALLGTGQNSGSEYAARPLALLNPGAGWGAKRWPVGRYAAVARGLAKRGFSVVVNAGPGEEELAEAIRMQSGGAALPATCSLSQLIALTRRVSLAVAGDTGPLHLACALGKPVVGIFGPTDPARNGPFGTRFRVLRSAESRRDHTRRAEPEAGLLTIQPEEVLQAADELRGGVRNGEAVR